MRMAVRARAITRDAHRRSFDLRSLWRLAIWGVAAAVSLAVAAVSAYSTTGLQRLMAGRPSTAASANPHAAAGPATAELVLRFAEMENETRRSSNAVRTLDADRELLITRIAAIERSLDDLTGSIKRQATSVAAASPPATP